MFRTAHPATASRPTQPPPARCPQCQTPVGGIDATGPGRHEFAGCGHEATTARVGSLPTR